MNYSELQLIIRYIRKTVLCAECNSHYGNNDIEILSTFDDQGLIHLNCPECTTQLLVHVTLSDQEATITPKNPSSKQLLKAEKAFPERIHQKISHRKENISLNDVIDIHSFLNNFDGDFKQLFSNTNKS